MIPFTVLGIGNRLFCDDGIGNYLVEALAKNRKYQEISFIVGETDMDYCLEEVKTPNIIILDAVVMSYEPGSVNIIPLNSCFNALELGISMHNLHLLGLLDNSFTTSGLLIGIEPFQLIPYYGLSKEMAEQFPNIIKIVEECLDRELNI